jgi:ELWxxDGT repeat protein/VCBS repeat-containing protein
VTAAKRIVATSLVAFIALVGSRNRPPDARSVSALIPAPIATLEAQSTAPVAELVADIRSGGSSGPIGFRVFKDALYFSANDGINGRELWRLDASGVPTMVADINPAGSSSPSQLTATSDWLYFLATTPDEGAELWRYDGVNPPSPAANVNPGTTGADLLYLTPYANQVVFRANNGTHGDELFSFDPVNGLRLFDIETVSASCPSAPNCESSPISLTVYDGTLYFSAFQTGTGFQLYSYNGSTYERLTTNIAGATGITGLGSRLIFGGFDFGQYRIYSYDIGSSSGVASRLSEAIVTDPGPLERSQYRAVVFNNRVYLIADDGINGQELWSTDGTLAGTSIAAEVNMGPGSSQPSYLRVFNGELYFEATEPSAGLEPRAFSGTALRLVADVVTGAPGGRFEEPAILGNHLVFQGIGAGTLRPFYTTGSGASPIEKSGGGVVSVDDPEFTFFNGALYFSGSDSPSGTPSNNELWRITLSAAQPTTTTLQSSLNPSFVDDQVTFTATVTGAAGSGTVTFLDGNTALETVTLSGGIALLDISTLGAGVHTITARYNGNASSAPSTSSDLTQVVDKIPTTTTLISSLNPSVFTETVTFTATVSPVSGTGTPTGDVTFFDGVNGLATVALIGNTATLPISALTGGAHAITASYAGSVKHEPSTSNAVQQTVTKLPTTTTLFSSPEPSILGDPVTFSAAVTGWFPTGEVTFSEGGVTLGTAPVVATAAGNIATFQTSTLPSGVHTITATYLGDINHSGSAAGDNHTVNDPSPPTPPVADSKNQSVSEDTPTLIPLTGSDVNNDPLTFTVESQPSHGQLTGNPPTVTYTPDLNYNGADSFSFKAFDGTFYSSLAIVSITVTPVNDAPVAVNDGYTTAEDTALIVNVPGVMSNDSDVDSSTLTASVVTSTVHGVLTLNVNGSFTYAPQANFFGADSFAYQINDGQLTSNIATVSITVTPVNDLPVANNDSYTTPEGTTLAIGAPGVLGNDSDLEASPLTATVVAGPAHGTLTLNASGSLSYTPTGSFAGTDSFTYMASDGGASSNVATVTITVVPRNLTWTVTGNLGARRRYHTATLLTNGKVLVTGGYGQGNGALSSAESYDPVTGVWTATGTMREKRGAHTATLLQNGLVLVAGGGIKQTETYDPATGTWTNAGTLNAFHANHTATLLPDGKVLVAGGIYNPTGSELRIWHGGRDEQRRALRPRFRHVEFGREPYHQPYRSLGLAAGEWQGARRRRRQQQQSGTCHHGAVRSHNQHLDQWRESGDGPRFPHGDRSSERQSPRGGRRQRCRKRSGQLGGLRCDHRSVESDGKPFFRAGLSHRDVARRRQSPRGRWIGSAQLRGGLWSGCRTVRRTLGPRGEPGPST